MDRSTLETIVRAHQAELYRYVRYLGADETTAEDLVQETFLAAFQSGRHPDMTILAARSAWLRGIARNVFLLYCRRDRARIVRADSRSLERAEAVWASQFLRAGDGFDYVEALRQCLGRLPDKHRQLVELQYARRRSRAEMARRFSMTDNGIKSLMRRIRAALADCVRRLLRIQEA